MPGTYVLCWSTTHLLAFNVVVVAVAVVVVVVAAAASAAASAAAAVVVLYMASLKDLKVFYQSILVRGRIVGFKT